MESSKTRPLAIVTGASSGIGYHLACQAAEHGYDLIVGADQPMEDAVCDFQALGAQVLGAELVDLATREGVDKLVDLLQGRRVDVLMANAGHGLGHAFLDQDFVDVQHVINTNITGTIYLLQRVAKLMKAQGQGRILITGSIAGFLPGSYQAVYNGTKAFIDSFAQALRNELKDTGVTVTCLLPGATDTEFFLRADLEDTKMGADDKAKSDPKDVAETGFKAMLKGEADVVVGLKNKLMVAAAKVLPAQVMAEQHRKMAEPGTADKS